MTPAAEKILRDATSLSYDDRVELADMLQETLHPAAEEGLTEAEHEAAWKTEIERRLADVASGKVKTIPWEGVQQMLRAAEAGDDAG